MSVVAGRFVLTALFAFAAPISAKVADAEPVGLLPEIVAEHGEIVIGGTFECHIEYLAKGSKTICDPTNIQHRSPSYFRFARAATTPTAVLSSAKSAQAARSAVARLKGGYLASDHLGVEAL